MSLNIKIQKKETLNETFWGQVAMAHIIFTFASKLMEIKHKFLGKGSSDKVLAGLTAAFILSRKKAKNPNISKEQQSAINEILNNAQNEIGQKAQSQMEELNTNPNMLITIDKDIETICNNAVIQISSIVKDKKSAEEIVAPIRASFENVLSGFGNLRKESAVASLTEDPNLKSSVLRSVNGNSLAADRVLATIVNKISPSVRN